MSAAVAFAFLCLTYLLPAQPRQARRPATKGILIYPDRQFSSDLAISGMVSGLPYGATGYVHYRDIAALPTVTIALHPDDNFRELPPRPALHATGIYLEVLARALGALPSSDMIAATCMDEYQGHYPASYIGEHHPILVIAVNRMPVSDWAKSVNRPYLGSYFVTHQNFVPEFKVLSHPDRAQVPAGVVQLNFTTIAATYGAIAPRGNFANGSMQEQGFVIARQNCLRCHNQGQYGGLKAGRTWMTLSTWAREQPGYFENYVKDPRAFESHAKMPGNSEYDKQTLDALAAYFRTFTEAPGANRTN